MFSIFAVLLYIDILYKSAMQYAIVFLLISDFLCQFRQSVSLISDLNNF